MQLTAMGYTVVGCTGGPEALERFEANPNQFDLVITDLSMPGMSGTQLVKQMKAIRQDIPVILCTGYVEQVPSDEIADAGIDGVIAKPAAMRELAEGVRKVLEKAEGRVSEEG